MPTPDPCPTVNFLHFSIHIRRVTIALLYVNTVGSVECMRVFKTSIRRFRRFTQIFQFRPQRLP